MSLDRKLIFRHTENRYNYRQNKTFTHLFTTFSGSEQKNIQACEKAITKRANY